ncbi:MAG: hypothetical protein AB1679_04980 [Actinomycetota bacterium]
MRLASGVRLTRRPLQGDAYLVDLGSAEILYLAPEAFTAVEAALQADGRPDRLPDRSRRLVDRLVAGGWLSAGDPQPAPAAAPPRPVAVASSRRNAGPARRTRIPAGFDDAGRLAGLLLGGAVAAGAGGLLRRRPGRGSRPGAAALGGVLVYALGAAGGHVVMRRLGTRTGAQVGATLAQVRAEAAIEREQRTARGRG